MSLLPNLNPNPFSFPTSIPSSKKYFSYQWNQLSSSHTKHLLPRCSTTSNSNPNPKSPNPQNPKPQNSRFTTPTPQPSTNESFPTTIPPKSRRGRKSEATHVEDFIRKSLSQTFESIRNQNPDTQFENALKDKGINPKDDEDDDVEKNEEVEVVEEEETDWPLDADIGLGIRASEYFDEHPIRNTVTDDGVEIDWEGEMDDTYVKEINCLEWESIAYHPSPLMVLVFERYNRAPDNWKVLKELEKAIKVYWFAKDKLPPRTVKIDINIEKDLAYALKVKECPQLLFLRGNMILYREKESRTADELVQMIAHFYYNAKKPAWIDDTALAPRYSR